MSDPEIAADYEQLLELTDESAQTETLLESLYEEWEELSQRLL